MLPVFAALTAASCTPPPPPPQAVWDCRSQGKVAVCYLSCLPGYTPASRARAVCRAGAWQPDPASLACSPSAALAIHTDTGRVELLTAEGGLKGTVGAGPGLTSLQWVDGQLVGCGVELCLTLSLSSLTWQVFPRPALPHPAAATAATRGILHLIGGGSGDTEYWDRLESDQGWQPGLRLGQQNLRPV